MIAIIVQAGSVAYLQPLYETPLSLRKNVGRSALTHRPSSGHDVMRQDRTTSDVLVLVLPGRSHGKADRLANKRQVGERGEEKPGGYLAFVRLCWRDYHARFGQQNGSVNTGIEISVYSKYLAHDADIYFYDCSRVIV
jgi:hypothetical protein